MGLRTKGLKASSSPWKLPPSTSKIRKTAPRSAPLRRSARIPIRPIFALAPRSTRGIPQTISDSTEHTRPASPPSPASNDLSFSTADTPTSVAARAPSDTPQLSSATLPQSIATKNTETEARNRCLTEFANPHSHTNPAHLSYLVLKKGPRLLYYVIVRAILSKPNLTDIVNTKTLELIYLLMTGKTVNYARYIPGTMAKVGCIQRPAPLPYANLLALVFKHFGVCLNNEIQETKPVSAITPAFLKNIQFFHTDFGDWKFVEDMTQDELVSVSDKSGRYVKPRLTSPQTTSPPSLLDHFMTLDECLYELQETTDKLEYIMVEHTDALDDIAHNQAVIENRLTRIQTLLTSHISEVHQKLGDIIHLGCLIRQCALKVVPLTAAEQAQSSAYVAQLFSATKTSKPKP